MENFEKKLDEYAKLVVYYGSNVQKGKPVIITASIEAKDFVRSLVKHSYERGASFVKVNWSDDFVVKETYKNADEDMLSAYPDFKIDEMLYYYEKDVHLINVYAEDPELLKGVDQDKLARAMKARSEKRKPLMKYTMNDIVSWVVVSVPIAAWAKKVFPDLDENQAMDKLWDDIFSFTRVDGSGQAIDKWKDHIGRLGRRAKILNDKQFSYLHYQADNGTDLKVGLPKNHIWIQAISTNDEGDEFIPNIPSEEIFSAPDRMNINGRVLSTKPLAYNGVLIEGMDLTFKDGEVVDFKAEKGQDALKGLLELDEGSKRMGELALVPHNSPISNANTIYYNTLFDENASCHFALGKAYPTNVEGGDKMTDEEVIEAGINDSSVHVDFMVGHPSLSIVGVEEDGSETQIFKDGNFVF